MIKEAIVKIVNKEDLTYNEAYTVMNEIMSGQTTATQNAAFLAALSTKSARAETTDEIAGCAVAMREPTQQRLKPVWSFLILLALAVTIRTALISRPHLPLLRQQAALKSQSTVIEQRPPSAERQIVLKP